MLEVYNNLTRFPKVEVLPSTKAIGVESFIRRSIFLYYSLLVTIVINSSLEFKKEVIIILKYIGINRISISLYNSRVNSINEVSYIPIIIVLVKITNSTGK